jgi:hypothetical protein
MSSADTKTDVVSRGIKEIVKEKYGQAALRVKTGGNSCCGAASSGIGQCDPKTCCGPTCCN